MTSESPSRDRTGGRPINPPQATPELAVSLLGHEVGELLAAGDNCLAAGDAENAETLYRAAATRKPWDPEPRYRLASAQIALDKMDEASLTLAEAREQHARMVIHANMPELMAADADAQALLKGADRFYVSNQMAAATSLLQRLAESNPDHSGVRLKLGLALQHQGRIAESIAAFESIERRWPSPAHHSFLHYARIFERATPDALYQEGMRYAERHAADLPKMRRPLTRRDGKLRIGYFSPLFNSHQLTKFFAPVMEHHDKARFSLVCYSGAPASDAVGQAIKAKADLWREVAGLGDEAFATQVAADEIDIFVDLWGHTAGNRLPVFARTPAPISVSWLNYIETTGLSEFDYVLHADGYVTPGSQALFSETIYPIGPVVAPFRQFFDMPPAGETPLLANGFMTFGCFGHPAKVTLETIRLWSRVLVAVPTSKLVLRSGYFQDPVLQRSLRAQFAAFGVGAERVEFPPFATGADFLATYKGVDLIFDPFPYQGMTTTLDVVSAGAPVLTWEGDHMHSRIAAVTLRACRLDELIAPSEDAYVETAVALAGDPQRLNALRARVRPGFEASPYRDEAGFTRRLETAFEAMAERQAKHPRVGDAAATAKASPLILPFLTVDAYARQTGALQQVLYDAERVESGEALMFPKPEPGFFDLAPLAYEFPAITLTTLRDVVVRGKSNMLTPPDAILRHALLDLATEIPPEEFYSRLVLAPDRASAAWTSKGLNEIDTLPEAAVFTDGVAYNYAHWMTEVLPRIAAFVRDRAHAKIPLIIDSDLHDNLVRSIALIAGPNAIVYRLRPNQQVKVGVLHNVSPTGYVTFKLRPKALDTFHHGLFGPQALRQAVAQLRRGIDRGLVDGARPKLFVRRNSTLRQVVNEAEVEKAMIARGFVVIEPEQLSFEAQMATYSTARMIVGATGAAMANLVFSPPDCPIVVMMPKFRETVYWYWRRMAAAAGAGPVFHVSGDQIDPLKDPYAPLALHVNFAVDVNDVLNAVDAAEALSG